MAAHNKFIAKGGHILDCSEKPGSMSDFLNDQSNPKNTNTQMSNSSFQKKHNLTNGHSNNIEEKLGRLHVQIREDLLSRLWETVLKRKKKKEHKKRATQRAVIEEALENYL